MPSVDLMGQHGGELAGAFAGGCVSTAGIMMMAGRWIWERFGATRIKELEAQVARFEAERERDREAYLRDTQRLQDKVDRLEEQLRTIMLVSNPPAMRAQVQGVISETRVTQIADGAYKLTNKDQADD